MSISTGRRLSVFLAGITLTWLAACADILAPRTRVEPAILNMRPYLVPDTVSRGEAITISVETLGGGCTREIARTDVVVAGALAEIRPFNRTRIANGCTSDLLILTHTAQVRFEVGGQATIRVIGEKELNGGMRGPAQIEHKIVVR